jgi:hypothetical protein
MLDLRQARDLGNILNTAYLLYRAHFAVFATIAVVVVVPLDLISLGVIDSYLWSGFDSDSSSVFGGVDIGYTIVTALITTPLVTAGLVLAVMDIGTGREPSARRSLEAAGPLLWTLLATLLLVAGGVILGIIALIIPGVYLAIRWIMAPQAVVAEKLSPTAAMRRSGDLVAGSWWRVLGIAIVITMIGSGLATLLSLPFVIGAAVSDVGALYVVGRALTDTVALSISALGMTILYFDLWARHAGAPAP